MTVRGPVPRIGGHDPLRAVSASARSVCCSVATLGLSLRVSSVSYSGWHAHGVLAAVAQGSVRPGDAVRREADLRCRSPSSRSVAAPGAARELGHRGSCCSPSLGFTCMLHAWARSGTRRRRWLICAAAGLAAILLAPNGVGEWPVLHVRPVVSAGRLHGPCRHRRDGRSWRSCSGWASSGSRTAPSALLAGIGVPILAQRRLDQLELRGRARPGAARCSPSSRRRATRRHRPRRSKSAAGSRARCTTSSPTVSPAFLAAAGRSGRGGTRRRRARRPGAVGPGGRTGAQRRRGGEGGRRCAAGNRDTLGIDDVAVAHRTFSGRRQPRRIRARRIRSIPSWGTRSIGRSRNR